MRLKEVILKVARTTGAFAIVRNSPWRRRRLMILCYHGVSAHDEHEWSPTLYVTQERLRRRLRVLRDGGYNILPLAEATRRLYAGTLPRRAVAITFDDGAVDFETRALPVLREMNVPATLYLTTFYCLTRLPVFDTILRYVIWKGRASGGDLAQVCGSPVPLPVATDAERGRARDAIQEFARRGTMSAEEKDALVVRVAAQLKVDYADIRSRELLQIMSPESVRALPHELIDVQLHTHRHRTPRDRALFTREIADNAQVIRDLYGADSALEHFCYPSGEYFGEFFEWLREQGVQYATTCVPDLASTNADPYLLPRFIDTMNVSDLVFESWVSGFAALMPRKREFQLDAKRLAPLAVSPAPR
jgi:peptidoglycan/xylan/chitin deacetylase (PgdA/CDA1 family)